MSNSCLNSTQYHWDVLPPWDVIWSSRSGRANEKQFMKKATSTNKNPANAPADDRPVTASQSASGEPAC